MFRWRHLRPLPPPPRQLRILVAEDNAVNQRLAVSLLTKLGHLPVVAGDGRLALEAFQLDAAGPTPFDLILMDCQMPEMGGFEATRRIREIERGTGRRIPIIALTAHAVKGDRQRCLDAGMDDYLTKPIDRNGLAAKISAIAGHPGYSSPWESAGKTEPGSPELLLTGGDRP